MAESFLKKREACIKKLLAFKDYVEKYNIETADCIEQLELRIEKMQDLWDHFDVAQSNLEEGLKEDQSAYRSEFENIYYKYVGRGRQLWKLHDAKLRNNQQTVEEKINVNIDANAIRLPKFDLPTFAGNYDAWLGFYDAFKTVIHERTNLSDIQKLQYLRSCLKDEALEVIKSLDTSAQSYIESWNLLVQRYNNKRVIVHNHLKGLLEYPQIAKDDAQALRKLLNNINSHVRSLKTLNEEVDNCNSLFIYLMTAKLDKNSHREWEKTIPGTDIPTVRQFIEFLQTRCQILEATNTNIYSDNKFNTKGQSQIIRSNKNHNLKQQHVYMGTNEFKKCPICQQSHAIYMCETFLKASTQIRLNMAKKANLCINCLKSGHSAKECHNSTCKLCNKYHNTLLHHNSSQVNKIVKPEEKELSSLHVSNNSEVLLSTARINIYNKDGKEIDCRVLLDPGSQSNFISEECANKLQLSKTSVNIPVVAINQMQTHLRESVIATIKSQNSSFNTKLKFLILPKITNALPSQQINRKAIHIPQNIRLADPDFHKPSSIDALIGAELFYTLLCTGQIRLNNHGAVLQKTHLGWIIAGKIYDTSHQTRRQLCYFSNILQQQLEKFWVIEEIPDKKQLSTEELACEQHFIKNVRRDSEGRYIVRLPFNENKIKLGNSYDSALKRFYTLEKRLNGNFTLKQEYSTFLDEYEQLGHMTQVLQDNPHEGYYLPHHAVVKQNSITTKLRVVFDGSAKTTTGLSLNDTLMIGATLQDDIYSLILRFRFHNFVLSADIEKMYRQIIIDEEDTAYQKILWRKNSNTSIKTYKLNTVTYGTASAPFLATRVLQQLALDEGKQYPLAARALLNDVYVDNFLTGTETRAQANKLRDELIEITKRAGFNLRQWSSNDISLINNLENSQNTHLLLDSNTLIKTLGIYWNSQLDEISYQVKVNCTNFKITKRVILSQIASLFDPLGLLGPVTVTAKILMQQIWKLNISWDESIPLDIYKTWTEFKKQLQYLHNFKIPRKIIVGKSTNIQLHGFCDASEKAYGACIFIRSTYKAVHTVHLLCAKSRVAPLKATTLPRLELCAALLLARLYEATAKTLNINFNKIVFWSDSTITLHWINTPSNNLKTFVANRVAEIQKITTIKNWRHVPTQNNPADALSRGQQPIEFLENKLWLYGPYWLSNEETSWPAYQLQKMAVPEQKTKMALMTTTTDFTNHFERFSSIFLLTRVIAYCIRFINIKTKKSRLSGPLSTIELQYAHDKIIKLIQKTFYDEIKALQLNKTMKSSKLNNLCPFFDDKGILRVGGRLNNAQLNYSYKHPILLPRCHVTNLIIQNAHIKNWHAGIQATLSAVRERYWPIDGKNITRKIIHKCIKCFRAKPRETNYLMGNLPKDRLQVQRPFTITGIDYCGPFFIKERKHRNRNKVKVYIAIFVCFSTKAVHIEVVSDLTTEAFLAALRRFCARRGTPSTIYSDNATNFVGAKHEIDDLQALTRSEIHNNIVQKKLADDSIKWNFSPPRAPHFGGIWEASVKSFKHHFIRTVGDALFTYEQLNTYAIEIEAILNSRPLTPLSTDPNDFQALTPSHFLIGDLFNCIPEHDFVDTSTNKLSNWQHIQKIKQHFWKRWQREYLNQLNIRTKWQHNVPNKIEIGTMVVVKDDNLPPLQWKLGRISQLHPGNDNILRVVTIKTATGEYKRSIKQICVLPLE